jgi:hypothetical protein
MGEGRTKVSERLFAGCNEPFRDCPRWTPTPETALGVTEIMIWSRPSHNIHESFLNEA